MDKETIQEIQKFLKNATPEEIKQFAEKSGMEFQLTSKNECFECENWSKFYNWVFDVSKLKKWAVNYECQKCHALCLMTLRIISKNN